MENKWKNIFRYIVLTHEQQRKYHSNCCNRQTLIFFSVLCCVSLTLFLHNVEVAKSDNSTKNYHNACDKTKRINRVVVIAYDSRENTEANKVAQRVDLYAEHLFMLCSVFHASCYLAVKKIADTRKKQAEKGYVHMIFKDLSDPEH